MKNLPGNEKPLVPGLLEEPWYKFPGNGTNLLICV